MSLPRPIALCLEDNDATETAERYLCCVALPGGVPGLGVSPDGTMRWRRDVVLECELWVSQDDCLMVERLERAGEIVVSRAGRSLSIPVGRPVELVQDDRLEVAGRTFTVHVHGPAATVHEPCWLPPDELEPAPGLFDSARSAAAAAVVGAVLATTACRSPGAETTITPSAEGARPNPPPSASGAPNPQPPAQTASAAAASAAPSASAPPSPSTQPVPSTKPKPIEPRPHPPKPVVRHTDKDSLDF